LCERRGGLFKIEDFGGEKLFQHCQVQKFRIVFLVGQRVDSVNYYKYLRDIEEKEREREEK
jgi:hypothetical protein